jgi:hypothetical protein
VEEAQKLFILIEKNTTAWWILPCGAARNSFTGNA